VARNLQIGFLHNIVGVRQITREPARQIVGGVKMRENSFFEPDGYIFFLQQTPLLFVK
jgi:hypothetical protein